MRVKDGKVTIADVAREAGVSSQTVSRVLNQKGEISAATRQMVLEVIDRLGYRPNVVARSLATQKTRTLGLVVPDIGNPFFAEVARSVESEARKSGYHVFLTNTDQELDREEAAIRAFEDQWVDGIILCFSRLPEERLDAFFRRHTRIVVISPDVPAGAIGGVRVDDEHGVYLAVKHLLDSGRTKIGFLAGLPGGPSYRARLRGFRIALAEQDIEWDEEIVVASPSTPFGGYEATVSLLNRGRPIDALVSFNDLVAIGAIRACSERGVRVPEDIAIIGFDDILLARLVDPSLTTIRSPKNELGAQAVRMLLNSDQNSTSALRELVLKPELVVRASAP